MDEATKKGMLESLALIAQHTANIDGLENKPMIVNELAKVFDKMKNTPAEELTAENAISGEASKN